MGYKYRRGGERLHVPQFVMREVAASSILQALEDDKCVVTERLSGIVPAEAAVGQAPVAATFSYQPPSPLRVPLLKRPRFLAGVCSLLVVLGIALVGTTLFQQ